MCFDFGKRRIQESDFIGFDSPFPWVVALFGLQLFEVVTVALRALSRYKRQHEYVAIWWIIQAESSLSALGHLGHFG